MKITDLTENDVIHIRNKKEAKGIKALLQNKGIGYWQNDLKLNIERVLGSGCISVYDGSFTYLLSGQEEGKNIIPASRFLKPSLKKRVKELEDRIEILEICLNQEQSTNFKGNENTCLIDEATDIEVHFDEVEKLPEKWCVLKTLDNWKEVGKWFQRNSQAKPNIKDYGSERVYVSNYLHYPAPLPEKYHAHSKIQKDYTEISFETFKRLVLKEDEKPVELEGGKWYKYPGTSFLMCVRSYDHEDKSASGYGINSTGEWFDAVVDVEGLTPATFEEVKDALIKEAERRGFKEGVKANLFGSRETTLRGYIKYNENWLSIPKTSGLIFGNDVIFRSDKGWAEIISEPEIDFSKAGQYVCFDNNPKYVYVTTGWANDKHFSGTNLNTGDHNNYLIIENFTLYTEPVTLQN